MRIRRLLSNKLLYQCERNAISQFARRYFQKQSRAIASEEPVDHHFEDEKTEQKLKDFADTLLYNTLIHGESYSFRKEIAKKKQAAYQERVRSKRALEEQVPLCLKYLTHLPDIVTDRKENREQEPEQNESYQLPFGKNDTLSPEYDSQPSPERRLSDKTWMTDYESFDDTRLTNYERPEELREEADEDNSANIWELNYGVPDPRVSASDVPCSGCGAMLHCKDTSIPGYLPSEIFVGRAIDELRSMVCQRCHFLKEYNIALNVRVAPDEYPKLLMKIQKERALAILMIDLLDFPCSIWPGIMDIIGMKRPVFIVGNKVDLLPQDSKGYLNHITYCLKESLLRFKVREANIKDIALISAKTGYGIEDLISKLHNVWPYKGNVYLIGCTNVGKSSLFNALLQSDFCKESASDLMQRATVSQWPGTTLNLLKFPILRPEGWKLQLRTKRLHRENAILKKENELKKIQFKDSGLPKYATLMGHIRKTFSDESLILGTQDPFSYQMKSGFRRLGNKVGIDETDQRFVLSKWCYDTPGVIHPEQIISLLTVEELMLTLPKSLIRPRSYYVHPGMTLLLAGLGRLDFLEECESAIFTVLASRSLPITICKTEAADEFYETFLGTELLAVPTGNKERLADWPKLKSGKVLSVTGQGMKKSSADVILSSAGWVSIATNENEVCKILPWTPNARGIFLRQPALLPYACKLKGKRIMNTPAYNIGYLYNN